MSKEWSIVLHSNSIDAGPEDEYDSFIDMYMAMKAKGYSKAYIKIEKEEYDIDILFNSLKDRFMGYSVQIFIKETPRDIIILVVSRKEEHNISDNMERTLQTYVNKEFELGQDAKSVENERINIEHIRKML